MQRDGISREKAQEWMQRQWPQEKVRQLAQYEIINDGRQDLDSQVADLLQKLSNTRNTHQLL
jgi:dephospho-CoA kinase